MLGEFNICTDEKMRTICCRLLWLVAIAAGYPFTLPKGAGPWVHPTSGQIWPKPQFQTSSPSFLILRPSLFQFEVSFRSINRLCIVECQYPYRLLILPLFGILSSFQKVFFSDYWRLQHVRSFLHSLYFRFFRCFVWRIFCLICSASNNSLSNILPGLFVISFGFFGILFYDRVAIFKFLRGAFDIRKHSNWSFFNLFI